MFWEDIWGNNIEHNRNRVDKKKKVFIKRKEQTWEDITTEEVTQTTNKTSNWKAPGIDKIPNFWLKYLTRSHRALAKVFNNVLEQLEITPDWLMEGKTMLIPQNTQTADPKNYRPITCLTTNYKLLTSILSNRLNAHLEDNILPEEKRECWRGSYGCKDQLLMNKVVEENSRKRGKNLSIAWIDYQKAFDSVPHS